jgi:REP element-mobilizing transposase RayT
MQKNKKPRKGERETQMSYNRLNYHIVYAVKERRSLLNDDSMARLGEYTAAFFFAIG